jgi:enoyl-CoA hydratase/carnithine racemase
VTAGSAGEAVSIAIEGPVAVITVDNPPVNALGNAILEALGQAARDLATNGDIRAVVLTGAGDKAFMAGADLAEFSAMLGSDEAIDEHVGISRAALTELSGMPQPVVAAIQASAMGGGLEVALCCDLLVVDPGARLGLPEVRLGLIPGAGGTQRLPQRIGFGRAKELVMLGGNVKAEEALALGLVNRVTAPGAALTEALELAQKLAALPARAVQAAKAAFAGVSTEALDHERGLFLGVFGTDDVREGVAAFVEKRPPSFAHR